MLQRAVFQLFLVAVLAISGTVSFRLPASWTELPNRIEPPTQLDQGLGCSAGEQRQQSSNSQAPQAPRCDVAIAVQDAMALVRSNATCLIEYQISQPLRALSVLSVTRARAPPRFVG